MSLPTGTKLGPYEILGPVGAGGMGEVYRARDPRLGREVAIKVLPEQVARDPDALARFEREARAVAVLSHPNILAIHDFGVEQGRAYSVTEMLEGQTLRQLLGGEPLPLRKVLDYGVQVAQGLAAAHDRGVVHRDLKPENLFITHDGRAKILDFGLAKVGVSADTDHTATPTMEVGTRPGTVLGTMGYMSPEQVRGQPVDHRSDLFSFGSVLYEMCSGRRAFQRQTPADTMSAILKEDPPPLSAAAQEISPAVQRLIDHCLEKNPAERFQSARDLAFHLDAVGTASTSSSGDIAPVEAAKPPRSRLMAGVFAAGLAVGLAAGAAIAAWLWAPEASIPPTLRFLTYSGRDSEPAVSSDGRLVAYTSVHDGRSQIWLKQVSSGDEVALTDGPDDRLPRISPDGSMVLFTRVEGSNYALYKIPVVGGQPRKIIDGAYDGDWSPDGKQVAFLRVLAVEGGISNLLGSVDATGQGFREIASVELAGLSWPRWSPDGRTIALVKSGTENAPNSLLLVDVEDGGLRTLEPPPPAGRLSSPAWIGDGERILYGQSESFASFGADQGSGRIVVQDVSTGRADVKMWLPVMTSVLDVLGPGSLVLSVSSQRQNLMHAELSEDSRAGKASWMTRGNSTDRQPVYSPDGQWVLFSSTRAGNLDLWKLSVETGAIRRITEDSADDWDPAFSPDGKYILWSSNRSGHFEIWICASDGTRARQLTQDGFDAENPTMTLDGRWVVYNSGNPEHTGLWKIHPDGTEATRLVPGSWSTPDVSPDGRYVAFRTTTEPRSLRVARVEDGRAVGSPIELPGSGFNARPRWMPDGRSLLFIGTNEKGALGIFIQDFVPGEDTSATRRPLAGFTQEEPPESFGISPDGTDLVFSAADRVDSLMVAQGLDGVSRAETPGR